MASAVPLNCSEKEGSATYILATGKEAAPILQLQHDLYAKESRDHLHKAGLSFGQTVWDIGCGTGTMTEYFANAVGNSGKVYALDVSQEQIKVARARVEEAGLTNVTFFCGDIMALTDIPINEADIVYARFVLMHLTSPEMALRKMLSLLKPRGAVALQESIMRTSHASVKNDVMEKYVKNIIASAAGKGVDYNIGDKLHDLCEKSGFKNVESYNVQHKLSAAQAKSLLLPRTFECENEMIKAGLATPEEMNEVRAVIENFPEPEADPAFYYAAAQQAYVVARKG